MNIKGMVTMDNKCVTSAMPAASDSSVDTSPSYRCSNIAEISLPRSSMGSRSKSLRKLLYITKLFLSSLFIIILSFPTPIRVYLAFI